jgi:hypothetical protein
VSVRAVEAKEAQLATAACRVLLSCLSYSLTFSPDGFHRMYFLATVQRIAGIAMNAIIE